MEKRTGTVIEPLFRFFLLTKRGEVMYKILIADDDNRTEESIKKILGEYFDVGFRIKIAKTGRQAIELAEMFCPDIVFIDLQIPGINGIEVMKEIKNIHQNVNMVIVSSSVKFDYAKEAIGIGILDYISKPFEWDNMVKVLEKIFSKVDMQKKKRSLDLEIKEKMEMITPIIENGFINALLYEKKEKEEIEHFFSLLGMKENTGYFMLLQIEDLLDKGQMQNTIRMGASLKKEGMEIKCVIKKYFQGCVSTMMKSGIIVFVPQNQFASEQEQDFCIQITEKARKMVGELRKNFKAKFKVGIGRIYDTHSLSMSYDEARRALEYNTTASVVHVNNLPTLCEYEGDYPINFEILLFKNIENGNQNEAVFYLKQIFDWMIRCYENHIIDIKLKVLEFVSHAEMIGYENGGMTYHFTSRSKYLEEIMEIQNFQRLQQWLEVKIVQVCRNIRMKKEENTVDVVKRAKQYIQLNYAKDIDLDEVSKHLQISSYYFSKLFKKKTGKNFIEYLTEIRMEHAKVLLKNSSKSMKEICMEVGYCDPNYFSRTFKKNVGVSPTEYKEEKYGA